MGMSNQFFYISIDSNSGKEIILGSTVLQFDSVVCYCFCGGFHPHERETTCLTFRFVCVVTIKAGRPSSQSHGNGQMPIAYPVSICLEVQPLFFYEGHETTVA
jgi:hypothetical protein